MRRTLLLLGCLCSLLWGYSDEDADGVEDRFDRCPGTSFSDLVDAQGCTVRSLAPSTVMDVVVGVVVQDGTSALTQEGDTDTSLALQFDLYHGPWSVQALTSYDLSSEREGMGDTLLAGSYLFRPGGSLTLRFGAGVILPTYETGYDNEAADWRTSVGATYDLAEKLNLFGSYSFTLVNDKDVGSGSDAIRYQNMNAFTLGAGSNLSSSLYASLSYFQSDSIYRGVEAVQSVTAYGLYTLTGKWFTTLAYSIGLSDSASDTTAAIRLGYTF
jgi:hypothetical protein